MDDASLDELLRAAGRYEAPPEAPCDLANRVRRLHIRRRRTRRAMGSVAALLVLLLGIVWTAYRPARQTRTVEDAVSERTAPSEAVQELPGVDVDRLRAEIAALSAEADARQQIVDELIARQRYREQIARLQQDLARPDPLEVARIEIEKTAFLLVDYAQQQSPLLPDSPAADEYRRVLKHFPGTNAARTAEMRLSELTNSKGGL